MATLFIKGNDGKYYDDEGYQVDASGRRFLQKMPHILQRIREMQEEARQRAKSREIAFEKTTPGRNISLLELQAKSLSEDLNHYQYHIKFLDDLVEDDNYERKLAEIDEEMFALQQYREHLIDLKLRRVEIINESLVMMKRKTVQMRKIREEIALIRSTVAPPKKKAKTEDAGASKRLAKAKKMVEMMNPQVIQEYCVTHNITKDQFIEEMVGTMP
jgi:hypothetical protein